MARDRILSPGPYGASRYYRGEGGASLSLALRENGNEAVMSSPMKPPFQFIAPHLNNDGTGMRTIEGQLGRG